MPRLAVVWDTNIYRKVAGNTFEALRDRESNHSVIAYTAYPAAAELMARLVDEDPRERGAAAGAVGRLVTHCCEYDGSHHNLRFLAQAADQVARYLFGASVEHLNKANELGFALGTWVHHPAERVKLEATFREVADALDLARRRFTDYMWNNVVLMVAPGATAWSDAARPSDRRTEMLKDIRNGIGRPIIAATIVREAASIAGIELTPETLAAKIPVVLEHFGLLVAHRDYLIRNVVETGADMGKRDRANGVVDTIMCAVTSPTAIIRGVPLIFVSDDSEILTSARGMGMSTRVLSWTEYQNYLALDSRTFADWAEGLRATPT